MPCYHPLTAWQTDDGTVIFSERGRIRRELQLPCGQCVGCRLERSRQWAVRCYHEQQMHRENCFITLTYSDEFLPPDWSLNYSHFQKFMKRLRKLKGPSRFFMCGEYGDENFRPHYHACLFGVQFRDRQNWRKSASGFDTFRSEELDRLWGMGHAELGELTFESAAYVARYVMKKVTGKDAERHYETFDPYTGEIFNRTPEFARMSLKPGIGFDWYAKFRSEVFPRDRVVINGREVRPPRYYDKCLQSEVGSLSDVVEYQRYLKAMDIPKEESSDVRLAVRETVAKARLSFKKRSL